MSSPRPTYPLHFAILNHELPKLIQALATDLDGKMVNECNNDFLTPLQLAAREGRVAAALRLVQAKANIDETKRDIRYASGDSLRLNQPKKTPFYLAVQRGHFLLARILLACGADADDAIKLASELKETETKRQLESIQLDRPLLRALLFWAVIHYEPTRNILLIEQLLQQLKKCPQDTIVEIKEEKKADLGHVILEVKSELKSDPDQTRFLELALYLKNDALITLFSTRGIDPAENADCVIRSAGYWAARHGKEELLEKICNHERAAGILLTQLDQDRQDAEYAKLLSTLNQYIEIEAADCEDIALKGLQRKIYRHATATYTNMLKLSCTKLPDHYAVSEHAFRKNNYVALVQLQNLPLAQTTLFKMAIKEGKTDFATFCFIANEIEDYQMALSLIADPAVATVEKLFPLFTPLGLQQQVMSRAVRDEKTPLSNEEVTLQVILTRSGQVNTLNALLWCLYDCFHHSYLTKLLSKEEKTIDERMKQVGACPSYLVDKLIPHLTRLNLIEMKQVKGEKKENKVSLQNHQVSDDVFTYNLIPFLDARTRALLSSTSHQFHRCTQAFNRNFSDNTLEKIIDLEAKIKKEIEAKYFWNERDWRGIVPAILHSAVSSAIFGLSIYYNIVGYQRRFDSIYAQAKNIPTSNDDNCAAYMFHLPNMDTTTSRCAVPIRLVKTDIPAICNAICSELAKIQTPYALSVCGMVVGALYVCGAFSGPWEELSRRNYFKLAGTERFTALPLNRYSQAVQEKTNEVLQMLKKYHAENKAAPTYHMTTATTVAALTAALAVERKQMEAAPKPAERKRKARAEEAEENQNASVPAAAAAAAAGVRYGSINGSASPTLVRVVCSAREPDEERVDFEEKKQTVGSGMTQPLLGGGKRSAT